MHRLLSIVTLLLALSALAPAHLSPPDARSEHLGRHRMIKKRQTNTKGNNNDSLVGSVLDPGAANAAGDPADNTPGAAATTPSANGNAGASGAATSTNPSATPIGGTGNTGGAGGAGNGNQNQGGAGSPTTPQTGGAAGNPSNNGGGGLGILGPILGGSQDSSSTTSSSSSSSTSSLSSTISSTTSSSTPTPVAPLTPAPDSSSSSTGPGVVTVTTTSPNVPSPTTSQDNNADKDNDDDNGGGGIGRIGRNTIIILVAIAGSIGVAGILWTIIRKWKFRPSREFEDRIQPIDWQPTPSEHGGEAMRERAIADRLERSASRRSHGSFTSAEAHGGAGPAGNNVNSNGDYLTADLPSHDFTAGPAHLAAPVGGYADLHRGPSPGPYQYEIPNTYPSVQQPYYQGAPYDQRRGY